jgi:hypothetical protein
VVSESAPITSLSSLFGWDSEEEKPVAKAKPKPRKPLSKKPAATTAATTKAQE